MDLNSPSVDFPMATDNGYVDSANERRFEGGW